MFRFFVNSKNGQPYIPEFITPVSVEPRGRGFEILVSEKDAKYLRARRYATEMALPKRHLSVSQILRYLHCPRQYYYIYELGLRMKPKSPVIFGSATHKAIEVNFKQKKETGQDLPIKQVQELWVDEFDKLIDEAEWEEGERPGLLKDEGVAAIEVYMVQAAPKIHPIVVEEEIDVPLEGVEFFLKTRIDVADADLVIHDTKTSSKTPNLNVAADDLQLNAYAIAHRHIVGVEEKGVSLDYLVRAKIPKFVRVQAGARTDKQIKDTLAEFSQVARAIRDKAFYRCDPRNVLCDPRYCGFYQICRIEE